MRRILVIDDTPDYMAFMAMLLENEHYRAIIRGAGEGAVRLAKRQKPDLIMLDLSLPDADGVAVLRKLKSDAATSRIPLIISTDAMDRIKKAKPLIEEHEIEVLRKPYGLDDLLQAVTRAFDGREAWAGSRAKDRTRAAEDPLLRRDKVAPVGSKGRGLSLWQSGTATAAS